MKLINPFGKFSRNKRLAIRYSQLERMILTLAVLGLIVGIVGLVAFKSKNKSEVPIRGGELVEGIVASSVAQVDSEIDNLEKIGLLRFTQEGEIVSSVADKYDISADGKTYTFTLHSGVDANEVVTALKSPDNGLSLSNIESKDNTIVIKLSSPYAPILANMTKPVIPIGPYQIIKRDSKEVQLETRDNFIFGEPYIPSIRIKIYPTNDLLQKAVDKGEVLAAVGVKSSAGFNTYTLNMPKQQVLFFNLNRDPWKNVDLRRKVAHGQSIGDQKTLVVTTTDGEIQRRQLDTIKQKFSASGVSVEEKIVDDKTFLEQIIPKRDFDAVIYGIDLGRDPDPYSFWHSSQATEEGKNISGFKSKSADRLMEEALLTTDQNTRKKDYQEFQKILDDQAPAIFLEQAKIDYLISSKVRGVKIGFGITPSDRFANVWEWYIRTKKVQKSDK